MTSPRIARFAGIFTVVVAVAIAFWATYLSETRNGLELFVDQHEVRGGDNVADVPEEMRSLRAMYRSINLIQKHYIDPTRIDPRAMLIGAMRAVQAMVAQVMVSEERDTLRVRIGSGDRRFPLQDVTTPWVLLQRAKEVFGYLHEALDENEVDFENLEYAAVNGMLQTLDPHSVLLTPDYFRDMKDKTQGKFGGLGIVISIRDGVLTIISPIDGTPADLAGLEAGDQIVKIGEASTVNMALNDAVSLLRGKPGTSVTVHILRKGWEEARAFDIVRAIIEVRSVESHLMEGGIGYVRIKDFQGNTAADLDEHLAKLSARGMVGLVLDLRNNPGGLLEAAIQVSDRFLESGVIVTTAGQGPTERDVRRARASGREPGYPIVMLANAGSASASEIVAGALKNHRRALLVGQRTFGKGSVQVLYDYHDGSALKLTTAQYLTPGDISIQSVGVVPDVELHAMRATEKRLDLVPDTDYRESDLEHHFEDALAPGGERAAFILSYLREAPAAGETPDPDALTVAEMSGKELPFDPDYEIRLARDLVQQLARARTPKVDVAALADTVDRKAEREIQRLTRALAKLGVDWGEDVSGLPADVVATARFEDDGALAGGTESAVVVAVTNRGPGTVSRLLATSRSDFRPLDDRELAFGRVQPGETVERRLKFKIPKDALSRVDDVLFSFSEAGGREIPPTAIRLTVDALDRPRFAAAYQIVDITGGNGDGRLQPGERAQLVVDVVNVGEGKALSTYATLKGLSGKGLFLVEGRASLEEIPAGERRRATFTFEIRPGFDEPQARFELAVADVDLRVYVVEKLAFPLIPPIPLRPHTAAGVVGPDGAVLREYPAADASPVARMVAGAGVRVQAETDAFLRVVIDDDRVGWLPRGSVVLGEPGNEVAAVLDEHSPPKLTVEWDDLVVRAPTVRISGLASDRERVRDVYIFVGENKVFFKPNDDPERPGELSFEADLPLEYGLNYVTVVAEETADLDTRQVITIRRDRDDGMAFLASRTPGGDPEPLSVPPTASVQ